MKFKKIWILWICYYSAAIIGTVLAAVLLRDRWNFNAWSAFPIGCALLCIFLAWFAESGRAAALYLKHLKFKAEWNLLSTYPKPSTGEPYPLDHHFFIALLAGAPLFLPAIFFLRGEAKAFFSIGVIFLLFFACIIYHVWGHLAREDKEQRQKEKKAQEEQQRREELGRWK
ncbi:MAG: hypothetical protein IJW22_08300 [Clostridia bacterium]|nr:hypothetical protein [Clostridia bacterium]